MGIFSEDTGIEGDIMELFDFIHSICDITKNVGRQWDTNGKKQNSRGTWLSEIGQEMGDGSENIRANMGRCRSDESWDDRAHTY